jgi:uncharacterized protein YkwD
MKAQRPLPAALRVPPLGFSFFITRSFAANFLLTNFFLPTLFAGIFIAALFLSPRAALAQSSAHSPDRPPNASRSSSAQSASAEHALFESLNRERASRGLAALQWDNNLAAAAREHAQRMADSNTLAHQLPGEPDMKSRVSDSGARFAMVAENIAVGPDTSSIHDGWMHSPGHRANILDAQLTAVGIATVRVSGGLFAVQDFSRAVVILNLAQQEKTVATLLAAQGLSIADSNIDARKNCDANVGMSGARAAMMLRYETPEIDILPDDIVKKIKSHPFQKAAVAACDARDTSGFAHFKIAIVLF